MFDVLLWGQPARAFVLRHDGVLRGYINRSATSAMMPRKAPSMYDPATGVLRPPKKLNDYQIYQQ